MCLTRPANLGLGEERGKRKIAGPGAAGTFRFGNPRASPEGGKFCRFLLLLGVESQENNTIRRLAWILAFRVAEQRNGVMEWRSDGKTTILHHSNTPLGFSRDCDFAS